jgi:hypothetical protein
MRYRRERVVADDWHGQFGSYDEWARLGPQPPYRADLARCGEQRYSFDWTPSPAKARDRQEGRDAEI